MNAKIIYIAWRNLFRNPRRTIASLLTVSLGAGCLTVYQGFNNGMTNRYRENRIRVEYGHGQLFPLNYRSQAVEEPWKSWFADPASIATKLKSVKNILEVYPRLTFFSILQKGGISLSGKGEGVISLRENSFFDHLNFVQGHPLTGPGGIILGQGLANGLGAKEGDTITILSQTVSGQMNGADLVVSGVFHTGIKDFDDTIFRVDLSDAQSILATDRVEYFSLQTTGVEDWDKVHKGVVEVLPKYEILSFDELDTAFYGNAVRFLNSQFQFIRFILMLLVGLGIFNMISVGLLERAPEVGALRANGEPRSRLFKIYLIESGLIGLLGGSIGLVLAWLMVNTVLAGGINMPPAPATTRTLQVMIQMLPQYYIQAISLSVITTIVASLLPIVRLMRSSIPKLLSSY
jgi:putative ABC transport system permease protein